MHAFQEVSYLKQHRNKLDPNRVCVFLCFAVMSKEQSNKMIVQFFLSCTQLRIILSFMITVREHSSVSFFPQVWEDFDNTPSLDQITMIKCKSELTQTVKASIQ